MLTVENTKKWLELFAKKVEKNKGYLSDLDTPIGDGDHGSNMARGVQAMLESITAKNPENVTDVLKIAAMSLISKVGGASGPLYGTAFLEMAKRSADTESLAEIVAAGLKGIESRGKVHKGEKTMIDVWQPVYDALAEDKLTKEVIENAVQATKDMKATKGRASYLGERSIGNVDPGAASSGYLFETLIEAGVLA